MKKYDEEQTSYMSQFRVQEQQNNHQSPSQCKMQDLLNEFSIYRKAKEQYLQRIDKIAPQCEVEQSVECEELRQKLHKTHERIDDEEAQTKYLRMMYEQLNHSKLQMEKRSNQLRESLKIIGHAPDVGDMQSSDEKTLQYLNASTSQMSTFQTLRENYRKQEQGRDMENQKQIDEQEEDVRMRDNKIRSLQQLNKQLVIRINQLREEEQIKHSKLQECFSIFEYIQCLKEIKVRFLGNERKSDRLLESRNESEQQIRPRNSTRNDILNAMDEFYMEENMVELLNDIVKKYRELSQDQRQVQQKYSDLIEEKQLLTKQLQASDEELQAYLNIPLGEDVKLKNGNEEITFNTASVEGVAAYHYNVQIQHHIKVNQFCIVTIYSRLMDMIIRMSQTIVWLSEMTKLVPPKLESQCTQYLVKCKKQNIQMYIPRASKHGRTQLHVKKGSFVSMLRISGSPMARNTNALTEWEDDKMSVYDYVAKFKQHAEYDWILQCWLQMIQQDLLTQQFERALNFDSINTNLTGHEIILKIYSKYAWQIKQARYILYFHHQFLVYKDIMKFALKRKSEFTGVKEPIVESQFLISQRQALLNRLQGLNDDDEVKQPLQQYRHSSVNKEDDAKYYQYFVIESNKIQKKPPRQHDKLIQNTLQDITRSQKKEKDENYQTSDQATSDSEYFNQERKNIKGILQKRRLQQPVSKEVTQSDDDSYTSQLQKTVKQVNLLQKISKLNYLQRNQGYQKLGKQLKQLNEETSRKISVYQGASDGFNTEINSSMNGLQSRRIVQISQDSPSKRLVQQFDPCLSVLKTERTILQSSRMPFILNNSTLMPGVQKAHSFLVKQRGALQYRD